MLGHGGTHPGRAELDVWDCNNPAATAVYAGKMFCGGRKHAELYDTITSPTTWVITIIGLMSTIKFVGLSWYYCKARRT